MFFTAFFFFFPLFSFSELCFLHEFYRHIGIFFSVTSNLYPLNMAHF